MANDYVQFATNFQLPQNAAKDFERLANFLSEVYEEGETSLQKLEQFSYFFNLVAPDKNLVQELIENNGSCDSVLEENGIYSPPDLTIEYDKRKKVLYLASENADLEIILAMLQATLQQHNLDDIIAFGAAYFCDKLRPGQFGGLACVVSKDQNIIQGTDAICEQLVREIANEGPTPH